MKDPDNEDPMVVVCAGPPACVLEGDKAMEAQMAGCQWCRRIICHPDGTETEIGPAGHA